MALVILTQPPSDGVDPDIPPFEQKNMRVTGRDDKPPPCLSKERRDKSGGPSKVMWGERGAIIWAMTRRVKREEWLQDIEARQRNVVFPDTVNNEARFWRNIIEGEQKLSTVQTVGIGLMVLAIGLLAFMITFDWR